MVLAHPGLLSIRRVLAPRRTSSDRCHVCAVPLDAQGHRHVVQLGGPAVTLDCVCVACHLLFTSPGSGAGRRRAVPDRWFPLEGDANAWDALDVPVGLAFFVIDSDRDAVRASYPGPAGVTESNIPLDRWRRVVDAHAMLASLEADVEAVLVRGVGADAESYVVPVDAAYDLAGRLRGRWQGIAGGPTGGPAVEAFFAEVRARARPRRTP